MCLPCELRRGLEGDCLLDCGEGEYGGVKGVFVRNRVNDSVSFVSFKGVEDISVESVVVCLHGGVNVEQMTRVTGYFSKVSNWNGGKRSELVDRSRSEI